MLQFCPVCRGLLQIKKDGENTVGFCSCGFRRVGIEVSSDDKTVEIDKNLRGEGVVSSSSVSEGALHICKSCGYDKAEISEIAANESSIFIYKCLKCGESEREIQGSSKF